MCNYAENHDLRKQRVYVWLYIRPNTQALCEEGGGRSPRDTTACNLHEVYPAQFACKLTDGSHIFYLKKGNKIKKRGEKGKSREER